MFELSPAFFSAVAALFSATTAGLTLWLNRMNSMESSRLELILSDWVRGEKNEHGLERIEIKKIENVGRGAALNLWTENGVIPEKPTALTAMDMVAVVKPGGDVPARMLLTVYWQNVQGEMNVGLNGRTLVTTLRVLCFDVKGNRYEYAYTLIIDEVAQNLEGVWGTLPYAAPGVRTTRYVHPTSHEFLWVLGKIGWLKSLRDQYVRWKESVSID